MSDPRIAWNKIYCKFCDRYVWKSDAGSRLKTFRCARCVRLKRVREENGVL